MSWKAATAAVFYTNFIGGKKVFLQRFGAVVWGLLKLRLPGCNAMLLLGIDTVFRKLSG